jgi:phage terminase large subunit-like protein
MTPPLRGYEPLLRVAVRHFAEDDAGLADWVASLPVRVLERLKADWRWQAHGGQREPAGDWTVWLLMAGRGFGKTRAGAEWVWARARETPGARIALIGGSRDDVVKVMIEGTSGLLRSARPGEAVTWKPSLGTVTFPNDARAFVYSAEAPEGLRGPEHHFAWADELAKWGRPSMYGRPGPGFQRAEAAWDNLMMGLRLGDKPKCVVTTTPRPVPLLKRVIALDGTVLTRGRMEENVHLPAAFVAHMRETYGGSGG